MNKNPSKGFTLIELLVVISIIALIASIVAENVYSARLKGQNTAVLGFVKEMRNGMELFKLNYGHYPSPFGIGGGIIGSCTNGCYFGSATYNTTSYSQSELETTFSQYLNITNIVNKAALVTVSNTGVGVCASGCGGTYVPQSVLYYRGPDPSYPGVAYMAEMAWVIQGNNSQCPSLVARADTLYTYWSDGNTTICELDAVDN